MSPETTRLLGAAAVVVGYLGFCAPFAWQAWRRRAGAAGATPGAILVAHASQTGFAETLAQRTAEALGAGARTVRLDALDAAALAAAGRVLFVVSTTGEGDAPDTASRFVRRVMVGPAEELARLEYGLLALGDRSYAQYCAFGRRLDAWLRAQGATPLFPRVEVDDGAEAALGLWRHELRALGGADADAEVARDGPASPWRLVERRVLNPAGLGPPAFLLAFEPATGQAASWRAGDIAVLAPRNPPDRVRDFAARLALAPSTRIEDAAGATLAEALAARRLPADPAPLAGLGAAAVLARLERLPGRDYSIASVPEDGRLELIVRQVRRPDGGLGLGSGWLTAHAPLGATIALRPRRNPGFHAPGDGRPLVLIGNGTGIAGLRAHLRARRQAGQRRNWLLFGERSRAGDLLCGEEIVRWRAEGLLARLDLAFSRDAGGPRYVQDLLAGAGAELRGWIAGGATILVCGSLRGMAPGVDAALAAIIGRAALDDLAAAGRYRRDVY